MWSPTHIQVLVKRAKGLRIKGKDGTNDAFVTIGLGKEKYQTTVKEKVTDSVEWCEQCELTIPQQGNIAEVVLTALHRNFLGVDEFLGMVTLPLRDFDVYERPRTKWYPLKCKPGQNKTEYRGELEVRTSFTVKAVTSSAQDGSTADLTNKKNKGSLQSLNKAAVNFGGSLLSLGQKEKKHFKKFAKTVSHKVEKVGEKAKKNLSKVNLHFTGDTDQEARNEDRAPTNKFSIRNLEKTSFNSPLNTSGSRRLKNLSRNQDPGVNSDEEDFEGEIGEEDDMFRFDALSHRSSGSSLNVANNLGTVSKTSTPLSGSLENLAGGELLRKAFINSAGHSSHGPMNQKIQEPPLDEWEQKLLGKKSIASSAKCNSLDKKSDTISQLSSNSLNSSRSNTLERQTLKTLPENVQRSSAKTIYEETPSGRKKIIPVCSDFESSPSPDTPGSPLTPSPTKSTEDPEDIFGKKKSLNLKWKSFKEKEDSKGNHARVSNESLNGTYSKDYGHSRTYSDGSGSSRTSPGPGLPPSGTRVVLGRETTPTPQHGPRRIPKEVWDRFEGKSREDLIEAIVNLQHRIEIQAKKQSDLEDYIDSLLMKVLATAPNLLQKENGSQANSICFNSLILKNVK